MSAVTDLFILLVLANELRKLIGEVRGWESDDDVDLGLGEEAAGRGQETSPAGPARSPVARGPSSRLCLPPEDALLRDLGRMASRRAGVDLEVTYYYEFSREAHVFVFRRGGVAFRKSVFVEPWSAAEDIARELVEAILTESPWRDAAPKLQSNTTTTTYVAV